MRIKNFIAIAMLATASAACGQVFASEKSADLKGKAYFISYEYGDEPCTMLQSYSIVLPSGLTDEQNTTIVDGVSQLMSVKPGRENILIEFNDDFKPMTQAQIQKYSKVYDNTDDLSMQNWYYVSEVEPFETRMGVIAMQVFNYMYAGGAHGGTFIGYVNYNPATDKVVTLEDYVKTAAGKKALKNILYRKAKSALGSMLFADASSFDISRQYRITDDGITFVYQQYEIAPYAVGLPEFTIPFSTLKSLDTQKTVMPKRKTTKKGKAPARKARR